MKVSIHQPNFLPWYPFFRKVEWADIFVVMVNCQFEKNNFQNRSEICGKWQTMSVNKGLEPILDKTYVNVQSDWNKIKANLPQYKKILPLFDNCISSSLANTNVAIIKRVAELLKMKTEIALDYPTSLLGTERLVDICKHYNATVYLSGMSGRHYLDVSKFQEANIAVEFQEINDNERKSILDILAGNT